jgi:hypothetical protein
MRKCQLHCYRMIPSKIQLIASSQSVCQFITGVKFFVDLFQIIDCDLGVDLRRFEGFMPEELLDMAHGRTVFHHVGGACVPKAVRGNVFPDPRLFGVLFHNRPDAVGSHRVAEAVQYQVAVIL